MKSFLFALVSLFVAVASARARSRSSSGYKCGRPALPFSSSGAQQYAQDIDYARRDYYGGTTSYGDMMGGIISIDFFVLFADGGNYGPGDFERYHDNIRGLATSVDISFTYVSFINGNTISTLRVSVSYDVIIFGNRYQFHDIEHDFHFDRHTHDMREVEYRTPSDDMRDDFKGFRDDVYRGGRSSSVVGGGIGSSTGPADYPSKSSTSKSSSQSDSKDNGRGQSGSDNGNSNGVSGSDNGNDNGESGSDNGNGNGNGNSQGSKGSKGSKASKSSNENNGNDNDNSNSQGSKASKGSKGSQSSNGNNGNGTSQGSKGSKKGSKSSNGQSSNGNSQGSNSKGSKGSKGNGNNGNNNGNSKGSKGSQSSNGNGQSSNGNGNNGGGNGKDKGQTWAASPGYISRDNGPSSSPSFASLIFEWWLLEHPNLVLLVLFCGVCAIFSAIAYAVMAASRVIRHRSDSGRSGAFVKC